MDILKKMHEDPDFLSKKYKYSFLNKLLEAKKTLQIFNDKGVIKDNFPNLHYALNNLEILMLTYGVATTYSNHNLGYNYICGLTGKKIIFHIYLTEKIKNFLLKKII
jgi:hypothetical protein